MDDPAVDRRELGRSLDDLRQVSRWLGGRRTAVRSVLELAREVEERPVTVLDLGTGGADVPLALSAAARATALEMRITATDLHPATLEFAGRQTAHDPAIEVRRADATALAFADGHFHIAMCNTTLHHFDDDTAARVLREMARVASAGVVVTDLERSIPALIGVHLLAATVWRDHPITKHDGPASVRAAFTRRELEQLARRAGMPEARVRRTPIFRLALTTAFR